MLSAYNLHKIVKDGVQNVATEVYCVPIFAENSLQHRPTKIYKVNPVACVIQFPE